MSTAPKRIRITADDLGWSEAVNRGIARALDSGRLSAVSVLATGPSLAHAPGLLHGSRGVSIGLHFDLTDFRCVAEPSDIPSLANSDGGFRRRSRRLAIALLLGAVRREHVARELEAQLDRLAEAGLSPQHLDGHRHAHSFPGLAHGVARVVCARGLGFVREVPLSSPRGVRVAAWPERCALAALSAAVGRRVDLPRASRASALAGLAEGKPLEPDWVAHAVSRAAPGLTEIVVHPGEADAGSVTRTGTHDRSLDLTALLSPALGYALRSPGVELERPG